LEGEAAISIWSMPNPISSALCFSVPRTPLAAACHHCSAAR
jgi:hypothetical protein